MRLPRLIATGTAILLVAGCDTSHREPIPIAPSLSSNSARARVVQTAGSFDAIIDPFTFRFESTPSGRNCILQVNGQLVFSGTIEGTATGRTTALVFAPCDQASTNPPGTFADVFKSELVFEGTIGGEPVRANMIYTGTVRVGGHIDAYLILYNGALGTLEVDAIVAVGGTYEGPVILGR